MIEIRKFFYAIIVAGIIPCPSWQINKTSVDLNKFVPINDSDKFRIITERVSELLESCMNNEIVSIGALTDSDKFMRWTRGLMEVAVLVELKYVSLVGTILPAPASYLRSRDPYKLDAFVVIASSSLSLEQMMGRLRVSKWWNSSGLCIVLDGNMVENGCSNAQAFLWSSWRMDLLSATFVCHEPGVGLTMYTFNPFTDRAPDSWQRVRLDDHVITSKTWALYKQKFIRGRTTCGNLNFDKTLALDGYKQKIVGIPFPPFFTYSVDKDGWDKYSGPDGRSLMKIRDFLNASWSSTIITNATKIDWVGGTGVAQKTLSAVYTGTPVAKKISPHNGQIGTYDLLINSQFPMNVPRTVLTYPLVETAIGILTKFAGYKTEEVKILEFMNPVLMVGLMIIFLTTIFVLGVTADYGCMPATLESVRIIINTSMTRGTRKDSLRMYLITVVFLFFITSAAMQCNLSALLTSPVPWPNIVSVEQLLDSDLKIYCYRPFASLFYSPELADRLVLTDHWNCSNYVIEEEKASCTSDWYGLLKIAMDNDLFLPPKISTMSAVYIARPDWPLNRRFSLVLSWLYDSGIMDGWRKEETVSYTRNWQKYTRTLTKQKIRKLKLADVFFIFIWLILGLFVSFLVFLAELAVSCYENCNSRGNKRKHKANKSLATKRRSSVFPFVI